MGKARDEFNRRMRDAAVPGDDEDVGIAVVIKVNQSRTPADEPMLLR